jgi:hypothetical protein
MTNDRRANRADVEQDARLEQAREMRKRGVIPTETKCGCEQDAGWTEIKCCNRCGRPHAAENMPWNQDDATTKKTKQMSEANANTESLLSAGLIIPIEDDQRDVRWWQYVNQHGTHMTKVVCRKSGWSIVSNRFGVGGLSTVDLDALVAQLREFNQNDQSRAMPPSQPGAPHGN